MPNKLLTIAVSTCLAAALGTANASDLTIPEIEQGYKTHAALTQLHRWYIGYEEPKYGIDNQLDILDPNVFVKSGLGEANGHADYAERVKKIPAAWKNAHFVKSTDIEIGTNDTVSMTVNITYANQGMLPDGAVRTADLTYTTALAPTDSVLPKFTSIMIAPNSDGTADTYTSAYPENRMRSLVHYWLALIEDPARNPEPVAEILADDFSLNFSSGAITDFEGFKAWLAGPASQVRASTHQIGDFNVTQESDTAYQIEMTFDWDGILPNEQQLVAKTRHTWKVIDDPSERFARIKQMNVEVLEPFRPKG